MHPIFSPRATTAVTSAVATAWDGEDDASKASMHARVLCFTDEECLAEHDQARRDRQGLGEQKKPQWKKSSGTSRPPCHHEGGKKRSTSIDALYEEICLQRTEEGVAGHVACSYESLAPARPLPVAAGQKSQNDMTSSGHEAVGAAAAAAQQKGETSALEQRASSFFAPVMSSEEDAVIKALSSSLAAPVAPSSSFSYSYAAAVVPHQVKDFRRDAIVAKQRFSLRDLYPSAERSEADRNLYGLPTTLAQTQSDHTMPSAPYGSPGTAKRATSSVFHQDHRNMRSWVLDGGAAVSETTTSSPLSSQNRQSWSPPAASISSGSYSFLQTRGVSNGEQQQQSPPGLVSQQDMSPSSSVRRSPMEKALDRAVGKALAAEDTNAMLQRIVQLKRMMHQVPPGATK
jgi:hypothetical protein